MTRIVVGVDRSPASAEALRWALRESQLRQAQLDVVLAWGYLDQFRGGRMHFEPHFDAFEAAASLHGFVRETLPDADTSTIERFAVDGFAHDVLLDSAASADLLVVGARGSGGFLGLLLGSVSQRCVEDAACSIAVVRGAGSPARVERAPNVAVGVDGSDGSLTALGWAAEEARLRGATLTVVHAWTGPAPKESDDDGARQCIDRALERVDVHRPATPAAAVQVVRGSAGAALLDASGTADLVVVGSRNLHGFRRLVSGSVAAELTRHAACPVVVVRGRGWCGHA